MNSVISTEFQGFNSYTPVVPTGPAAPYSAAGAADHSEDKASNKKSGGNSKMQLGGLDENMIKLLTEHGLESDVYSFLDQMEAIIMNAYNPITGKVNYASYKLMLPQLSRIREEGKAFEEARKKMEANGAIDEVAVSDRGQVYVVDPDAGIVKRSVSELQGDEYLLTNGELAKARATNPIAAWNTDFTQTIANSTSTQAITKYILDSINKLGKAQTSGEQFTDADDDVISGAQVLTQMIKGNKGFAQTTIDAETQKQQAKYALGYLASMMPSNMMTVLQLRAQRQGVDVIDLMDSLIQSTTSTKATQKTTFKGAEDGSQVDENSNIKLTPAIALYTGRVPVMPNYQLSYGTSNTFTGEAQISNLVDASNNNLKAGALLTDFYPGDMKSIFDTTNIVMGNVKIDNPNMIRVKDSSMAIIELPVDQQAAAEGVIRPDLSQLKKKDIADTRIRNEHATTPEEINMIYRECELNPKYDANGNELTQNYIRFAVIKGYIDENTLDKQAKVDDDPWENYLAEVRNEATNSWLKSLYKTDKIEVDDLYEGNIYMPMIANNGMYRNAAMGAFNNLTIGQSTNVMREDATLNASKKYQYKPAGSISQYQIQ